MTHVIVIGAGLAGLAAAWRLRAAGCSVTVLERSARAGGRVGVDECGPFRFDRTLESLHGGERHLLGWIRELGLAATLLPLRPLQLAQVHRGETRPIDPQSLSGVARLPGVGWRDAARLLRFRRLMARYLPQLDPTAPERASALDFRSAADFARLYFGPRLTEMWIAPELVDAYGGEASDLSRVAVLMGWRARATGRSRSVHHGVLRGPLGDVAERAAESLPIRFEVEATRVDELETGGFRVACRARAGGEGELEADAVVVATSAAVAARLVAGLATPAERDFLTSVPVAPEIVLSCGLSAAPTGLPQRVRVPPCEEQPISSVLVEPGLSGGRAPRGTGIVALRASERFAREHASATDEVVQKSLLAALARLVPAAGRSVEHAVLQRRPASWPRFEVGTYRALARFRRVQADRQGLGRKLAYAGDWLVAPSAEGSVVAGLRAAADLLATPPR